MEDHTILSERLEEQLKAVEWARTEKTFKRKGRAFVQRANGKDDPVHFKPTKKIDIFWF